ncbi:TioE family transcriptional regulator [Streptomyces sp. NPDC091383]|uniref:TioE family transcriptional regulator n=1 Tax=Streptomyces sp. NPDC091383 TaxID=3365996 RepID=UPI0037F7993A
MRKLRPVDLAREHGITPQAVRNYESEGFLPPAERTGTGYRVYTEVHAAALRAQLALVPAHGHARTREIMRALHAGDLDTALTAIDHSHAQLLRDRETLESVAETVTHLATTPDAPPPGQGPRTALSVGKLAERLGVTPATLRNWEEAGIVVPRRTTAGHRAYTADDVRDAQLAHLLRRGGYPLEHIANVVRQIRTAGGTRALSQALEDWQRRLTARGIAMLEGSGRLAAYVRLLEAREGEGETGGA